MSEMLGTCTYTEKIVNTVFGNLTVYLNDFSGTSSANYANTQNVKRAEETQG